MMSHEGTVAQCPYCNETLKKRPQRRTKCFSCGNYIYVKRSPDDTEKRLLTEEQAKEVEAKWAKYQAHQDYIRILSSFGFSEKDLEKEKHLSSEKSEKEIVFALLQKIANQDKDLHRRKMACYEMALILEKEDGDFKPFLEHAARNELLNYQRRGVNKVEVLSAGKGNSCETCGAQSGKRFAIEEALQVMPIPCRNCTTTLVGNKPGFCRCTYVTVI